LILKFAFFDAVDNILGNRPATKPPIDSMTADLDESNASESGDDNVEQEVRENDSGESSNTATENDDDVNKDEIITKKEEKVDVKPIVSSNKKK